MRSVSPGGGNGECPRFRAGNLERTGLCPEGIVLKQACSILMQKLVIEDGRC
jgi:hypothetical protein